MKDKILAGLSNPQQLEQLYRADKTGFKRAFQALYPTLPNDLLTQFWQERLHYEKDEISWGSGPELLLVGLACLLAGLLARIPILAGLDPEYYFPRNIGFLFLPLLTAYFAWRKKLSPRRILVAAAIIVASVVYINLLPDNRDSDTLVLACIHLPLLLWAILGFAFVGNGVNNPESRLSFLRYNGDLLVMCALLLISGGIMTGITIGLFSLIGLQIEQFYFQNIVVMGLPAVPVVATYLIQTNPHLVNKVSPVIARIFSPLVLVMLVIYLGAIIYSGKDPYNDREFLMIFNVLLLGVMAIILFSVAEWIKNENNRGEMLLLFLLSGVTIIVNGIALSAILFRITEMGITPNRVAVLGGNVLMLANLLLVSFRLFRALSSRGDAGPVGQAIAFFLPVYAAWTVIVTFLFPLLFGFK